MGSEVTMQARLALALSLILDLYEQVGRLSAENAELRAKAPEAEPKETE